MIFKDSLPEYLKVPPHHYYFAKWMSEDTEVEVYEFPKEADVTNRFGEVSNADWTDIQDNTIDKQRLKDTIIKALQDYHYISKEELAGVVFREFNIKED